MKTKIILILAIVFSTTFVNAKDVYTGHYRADVIRVLDGDTIELDIHIWPQLVQRIKLRLNGINTPEKRGKGITECEKKAGQAATTFTQQWLKRISIAIVTDVELGKYAGRVLGKISKEGNDLGEALIKAGHAKIYSGGKRSSWC